MAKKIILVDPAELRPLPLNKELYGRPQDNDAYKDIKQLMTHGFNENKPLTITEDRRIVAGVTRWHIAKALGLKEVPCLVFTPTSPETAEDEYDLELIDDNHYRNKTKVMLAREQRKKMEIQKRLARKRMGSGSDGGPSKSADRVGADYRVSGRTVTRSIKVLEAIEQAEADGDRRKAERLTDLLEHGKTGKALAIITGKPAAKKAPPVDVPRTLNDHNTKAYSENYEACAKVRVPAEIDILEANVERMLQDVDTARTRLGMPAPSRPWLPHVNKISVLSDTVSDRDELLDLIGELRALAKSLEQKAKEFA
jgi:ParB-like chromosome segregation protein Spo0J